MFGQALKNIVPEQRGQVWRRAALLSLLCAILATLAASDAVHSELLDLLAAIQSVIAARPVLGAAVFVLAAAISAMFAFASAAAIVPVAVYAWGAPLSILLLWLGWVLGGACAYSLSRFLGRRVVQWLTANNGVLQRLETKVPHGTPLSLIVLFQLALPSEIPGYVLGLANYSWPRYLLSVSLAELPYAAATVYLGDSFVHGRGWVVLAYGLALICLSLGAFYALRNKLKNL